MRFWVFKHRSSSSLGHSLTQFVRHCADHFLNSEHKEIRMEAARTCSRLLTPSIHLISGHGHVVSQTAVQVVADVLSKLLVVGITDPGETDGTHRYTRAKKSFKMCTFTDLYL